MQYIRKMIEFRNKEAIEGAKDLADRILSYLNEGKKVLWLVCGGSNIPISVKVLKFLKDSTIKQLNKGTIQTSAKSIENSGNDENSILKNLTVTLTDERYGSINHPDSNWRQLREKGFDFEAVTAIPVLVGKSFDETTKLFGVNLRDAWSDNDIKIGQFGVGADGHIAGVLPKSKAAKNVGTVFGYEAAPFRRVTITLATIEKLDCAYAFVYGESKREAMSRLHEDLTAEVEPAQVLKKVKEVVVYSDFV